MFSFDKKGAIKPIAVIKGGNENNALLYLHPHGEIDKKKGFFDYIELKPNQFFEWFPDVREDQSDVITMSGKKGVGKSTYASTLAKQIKKILKLDDEDCIVFKKSQIEDKAFDDLNPVYWYVDNEFLEEPPTVDSLTIDGKPKILILDDLDNIQSNSLKKAVVNFKDSLLREGRKYNLYVIICNHRMANGRDTKAELTESDYFTFFPHGLTSDYKYVLQKYADMSLDFIRDLKNTHSRWVMVHNGSPMFILTDKKAFIFDNDREQDRLNIVKKKKNEDKTYIEDYD